MNEDITGGCLCGAVRYRCTRAPISMGLCQCERCQRQSGSAFLIATVFARDAVCFESGALKVYAAYAEDGAGLYRHFCPECGAAIMITLERYPDIRSLMGGSLDDKSLLRPTFSLWCDSAQPWLRLPPEIELFAGYPDGLIA